MGLFATIWQKLTHKTSNQLPQPKFDNAAALIEKLYGLIDKIEKQNIKIVGNGVYSTSGHDNSRLVSASCSFARISVATTLGHYCDDQLVSAVLEEIRQNKQQYLADRYDPDGVAAGTLVDIELALKNQI